jgi:hypothetical protein
MPLNVKNWRPLAGKLDQRLSFLMFGRTLVDGEDDEPSPPNAKSARAFTRRLDAVIGTPPNLFLALTG